MSVLPCEVQNFSTWSNKKLYDFPPDLLVHNFLLLLLMFHGLFVYVSVCRDRGPYKNEQMIACGADSCEPKEPCIRWECTLVPPGE